MAHTLGRMLHRILKILHHALLPDHLLDLPLLLHVERIVVQPTNELLPLEPLALLPRNIIIHYLREPLGVLQGGCQLWVLALEFLTRRRGSEDLEPNDFGVVVRASARPTPTDLAARLGDAGASSHVPHVQGEHVSIDDAELLHGLGIVGDEVAVVVYVLSGGEDGGFTVDSVPEGRQRHVGEHLEGEELAVLPDLGVCNVERDLPVEGRLAVCFSGSSADHWGER